MKERRGKKLRVGEIRELQASPRENGESYRSTRGNEGET